MSPSLQPATVFLDRAPSASSHASPYAGPVSMTNALTDDAQRVRRFALLDELGPYSVGVAGARETTHDESLGTVEATFHHASPMAKVSSPIAMPWITTYLDDGAGNIANNIVAAVEPIESVGPTSYAHEDVGIDPASSDTASTAAEPIRDDWPLLEAGQRLSELAAELRAFERADTSESHAVSTPSLPMWSDDELIDIMPVTHSASRTPPVGEWATTARRDFDIANDPEAAAVALEGLAARVRAGTVHLPQFSAELGDAAALAAALTVLLGIRR